MLNGVWSSSSASISWSNSVSTSPRRSGTLAIVRTPGPGRDPDAAQRRDHAAPGRLGQVEARGLRGEQVGDVPGDQRARGGHADEDRARPGPDRARGLLAQRGVGLVADDDRVGVGDLARVAHEPLVGLDRDRAVGGVLAAQQRSVDPVAVAAVAQLAVELVDQVAAVGEDQDAARARGLDEAECGDGLAGAGGVLEPEAAVGVGVVGGLVELDVLVELAVVLPVLGLLVLGLALVEVLVASSVVSESSSPGMAAAASWARLGLAGAGAAPLAGCRCRCAGPRPAARSACPTGRRPGGPRAPSRRPGAAPPRRAAARARAAARTCRRQSIEGRSAPASISASGGVERAPAGRPGRQRVLEGLALVDELLTREQLRPRDRGRFRKRGGITHTDRKVAFRKCEPRRYCVATQAGSLETVRGRNYPQKRMPPRRTRLGGMASPIKAGSALARTHRSAARPSSGSVRTVLEPPAKARERACRWTGGAASSSAGSRVHAD